MRCGSCGKALAAGVEMLPGHDGEVWYLGGCCWDPPKAPTAAAAEVTAVVPAVDLSNVPAPRYPAKEDVGDFSRPAKKRKRG